MDTNFIISSLLEYAFTYLKTSREDVYFLENMLMRFLEVDDFNYEEVDVSNDKTPDRLVALLDEYFIKLGLDDKQRERRICEIFGALTPLPSMVHAEFEKLYAKDKKAATDYFFDLCIKNNYVQKSKIDKNIIITGNDKNHLVVTINLSKPEKSNKDIAKALEENKNAKHSNFPACMICKENEGCSGTSKTGVRNNLRLIPLKLNNKNWYMQYSPYGYFNEHCIVLLDKHSPMVVNRENLGALLDFVDIFPHYLIGSNSDLPIVGGSILTHEHFQGGCYNMPILSAKDREIVHYEKYENVKISILDWPVFTLKFSGTNKVDIADALNEIYQKFLDYSDEDIELINASGTTRHNTITTIVKKVNNTYNVFVAFRNNRTNETNPGGLFHVRKEYQHIKNEGIGIIECMGLFVFPARLKRQLGLVNEIIANPSLKDKIYNDSPDLKAFDGTINSLLNKEYASLDEYLLHAANCMLEDVSIFKYDKDGSHLDKFLKAMNLTR